MFEFLQSISDFFTTGIYTFFEEAADYFIVSLLIWYLKAKLLALEYAWDIASQVLDAFQISAKISAAFGLLPASAMNIVNFFRFPEAVNLIVSAAATRWVIKVIPGL